MTAIVRSTIAELPDGHRIVLTPRDIEGLSTADVATAMGLSEMTVTTRLHRDRAALEPLPAPLMKADAT